MTKHRTGEEWREEILQAAQELIEEQGYHRLTMEGVAARTRLSKGGVYRFFSNKQEVALCLFRRMLIQMGDFETEEVMGWNLSVRETSTRLLYEKFVEKSNERAERIWMELLPETLRSEEFRAVNEEVQKEFRLKYKKLMEELVTREGGRVSSDFADKLETAIDLGLIMTEGLAFRGAAGMQRSERLSLLRKFFPVIMDFVLGDTR